MLQRTVVTHKLLTASDELLGESVAQAQNDLDNNIGKIDIDETNRQNQRRGINMRDQGAGGRCAKEEGAPALGHNEIEREKNAPCGSLLTGGSIGAPQKGPCGSYIAITKTFIDGNFRAPGIVQTGFKKCRGQSSGADMHVGTLDGQRFPMVALGNIGGGLIAWPGQPKPNQ